MALDEMTIAVVVPWAGAYYARPVLRGISHVLSAAGARVISLTGEEWSTSARPRNTVYELLDRRVFHGAILLGGTLFHETGAAAAFRARHHEMPLVNIGAEMPGATAVMADNASGVRDAVSHLAALGRRRIAFVRGPTGNTDAAERYRGYREGLERAGLPVDPNLVAPGAFVLKSGTKAVDLLLDERGVSFDALIAANDETARGALEALQHRGVLIPDDIAIVGFDDVADAELCRPKLTTVAQPLVEQGVQAALQLERLLSGEALEARLTLDTHLVYRDSCGGRSQSRACPPLELLHSADRARVWMDENFPRLWPWLRQRTGWTRLDEAPVRDAVALLLNVSAPTGRVERELEDAVRRAPLGEAWRWFRGLEALGTALPAAVAPSLGPRLDEALRRAARLVNEAIIVDRIKENHRSKLDADFTHALGQNFIGARNLGGLLQGLRQSLEANSTFAGYQVALFDQDPSWSRLVFSSTLREASPERSVRFPTRTALPQAALPRGRAATLCAATLSDGQPSHGTLIVEAALEEATSVRYIAERIGCWLNVRRAGTEEGAIRIEDAEAMPGRIGSYQIRRRLGSGGMATVYLAETRVAGIPRPVALKLLHPHLQEVTWSEQLVEEARVTVAIRHPNVVQLLELGEHQGAMFLVMEYVDGSNLSELLNRAGAGTSRLALRVAGRILADALIGLAAAHDLRDADGFPVNLVHRDISPHNILVGRDGITRITDFGIARRSSDHHTQSGVVKGKLRYMSPEHASGSPVDPRTDVWSMGVVAWELLTGQPLHHGVNDAEVVRAIAARTPPPVSSVAEVPEDIASVVERALTVNKNQRFSSALEFRTALVAAYRTHGGIADSEEVGEFVRDQLCEGPNTVAPGRRSARSPATT